MSKLQKLITDLCPNGVSMFKLGDLEDNEILKLGRGDVISKTDLNDYPGSLPVYSSSAASNGLFGRYGKFMFDDERITWSIDGGGKFFYRPIHQYSVTNVCGWLKVLKPKTLNTKYIYYVLISAWGGRTYNYTVKAHPSVIREDYLIPLPPIDVQYEIVRILDTFTELEAELETELEARKSQYEHYRSHLFAFHDTEAEGVRWIPIGQLLQKIASLTPIEKSEYRASGLFPIVNQAQELIAGFSDREELTLPVGEYIVFGDHTRCIKYLDERFIAGESGTLVFSSTGECRTKYLYYAFMNLDIQSRGYNRHWSVVKDMQIPVPTLEEQDRIVGVLDIFSELIGEISGGLPAEISARRQQYEYYRNKLLTFKELEVA